MVLLLVRCMAHLRANVPRTNHTQKSYYAGSLTLADLSGQRVLFAKHLTDPSILVPETPLDYEDTKVRSALASFQAAGVSSLAKAD